ncbi:unnamed protein product [Microthlaspi erraticum]|uniref:Cystatin domain-containing protein n=1 Tax=Microthlaspi erraticum TaxID=1685480 RepID=A0A6D2HIB2_9BRAS|nr:unnamed protein product [Microthlaspi erraticum]
MAALNPSETKDGSSSEPQLTEAMDSCFPRKRKAEATNAEDPEESEGDGEDSDSGWDKDSFDGLVFDPSDYRMHSSDSDEEFYQKALNLQQASIETKGFFEPSQDFPRQRWSGIVCVPDDDIEKEIKKGITGREFMGNMASECGKSLIFDHFLRANFNPGSTTRYYITFAARESDSPDAPLVEYQAKAARCAGKTYPILCRPAPPPNKGNFTPKKALT